MADVMVDGIFLLFTTLISFGVTKCAILLAHKIGFVDSPNTAIKLHEGAVAYGGGVALWALTTLAYGIYCLVTNVSCNSALVILSMPLMVLGLCDDIVPMGPYSKLLVQMFVGMAIVGNNYICIQWAMQYGVLGGLLVIMLFLLSIVLINMVNMLDVHDGLAGSYLFITIGYIAFILLPLARDIALYLVFFLAAIIGFLWYNFPPSARIYMGDAGSLYGGSLLAYCMLGHVAGAGTLQTYLLYVATCLMICSMGIIEVGALLIIRFLQGKPLLKGSRDHFSHYLARNRAYSKYQVIVVASLYSVAAGAIALALFSGSVSPILPLIFFSLLVLAWLLFLYAKLKILSKKINRQKFYFNN